MAHCTAALCEGAQAPRLQKHRVLQTSSRLKSCQTTVAVCKRIVSVGALESLSKGGNFFPNRVRRIVFLGYVSSRSALADGRTRLHAEHRQMSKHMQTYF